MVEFSKKSCLYLARVYANKIDPILCGCMANEVYTCMTVMVYRISLIWIWAVAARVICTTLICKGDLVL